MTHKLLLADDSITIQRVIELTFADEDVQVLAVGDGQKAIASIQSDRPDIVLADVGMPERDGYEVAEFIKGNPQLASIPVLLLTGAFEPIDETRARAVGCDGVLVKPFEPQMVINRVKDLLAGRRSGGLWGNKTAPSPDAHPSPAKDATVQPAPAESGTAASASLEDYFDRLDAAFASVEAASDAHGNAPAARSANAAPAEEFATGSSGLANNDLEGWDPDLTGDPVRSASAPATPPRVTPPMVSPPTAAPPAPPVPAATVPTPTPPIRFKPVAPPPPEPSTTASIETAAPPTPPTRGASIPFVSPAPPPPAVVEQPPVAAEPAPMPVVEHRDPAPAPASAVAPVSSASVVSSPTSSSSSSPSLAEAFAALLSAEQGRSISASKVGASSISEQTIDEIVSRVISRMTDQSVRETVLDVAERLVREEIDRIKEGSR